MSDVDRIESLKTQLSSRSVTFGLIMILIAGWARAPWHSFSIGFSGASTGHLNVGYAINFGPYLILMIMLWQAKVAQTIQCLLAAFSHDLKVGRHRKEDLTSGDVVVLTGESLTDLATGSRIWYRVWINRIYGGFWYIGVPVTTSLILILRYFEYCSKIPSIATCSESKLQRAVYLLFEHWNGGFKPVLQHDGADRDLGFPWIYPVWQSWTYIVCLILIGCLSFFLYRCTSSNYLRSQLLDDATLQNTKNQVDSAATKPANVSKSK